MTVHAYGDFEYNVWIPAYSHHYNKEKQEHNIQQAPGYEIRFLDSEEGYEIRSLFRNGRLLKHTAYKDGDNSVLFRIDGVSVHSLVSHVMLISAFPNYKPERTVDNVHKNMNIMNLQWLDMSANSGKRAQFKPKDEAFTVKIPNDEIWKDFTLDGGKTTFKISNYARIQKPSGINSLRTHLTAALHTIPHFPYVLGFRPYCFSALIYYTYVGICPPMVAPLVTARVEYDPSYVFGNKHKESRLVKIFVTFDKSVTVLHNFKVLRTLMESTIIKIKNNEPYPVNVYFYSGYNAAFGSDQRKIKRLYCKAHSSLTNVLDIEEAIGEINVKVQENGTVIVRSHISPTSSERDAADALLSLAQSGGRARKQHPKPTESCSVM